MIQNANGVKLPESHKRIFSLLATLGKRDTLHHAYLFIGPRGVGKRWIVETLSQQLLNQNNLSRHPDFLRLDASTDGSIDNVRSFIDAFISTPLLAKGKIGTLLNVDSLSAQAQNTLLKTLEEPPKASLILLTASHQQSVLPTISSRCNLIRVPQLSEAAIQKFCSENHLSDYLSQDAVHLASGKPELLFRLMRNAESIQNFKSLYMHDLDVGGIPEMFRIANTLANSEEAEQDTSFLLQHMRLLIGKQSGAKRARYLAFMKALVRTAVSNNRENVRLTIESAIV